MSLDLISLSIAIRLIRGPWDSLVANMWGRSSEFPAEYLLDCFPYLRGHIRFELTPRPDLAFYSVYGYVENRYDGARRLVYAGEPGDHLAQGGKISTEVSEQGFYHFGITCAAEHVSPSHCYMPQGLLHLNLYNSGVSTLLRRPSEPPPQKEFFCNFIYSNGHSRDRIEFFRKLSRYKRVESLGHVRGTTTHWLEPPTAVAVTC